MGSVVLAGATSGSTTITPTDAVTATVTLPSTGGTLQTSGAGFTTNGVAYASSTSALTTAATFTWNNSTQQLGFQNAAANGYAYIGSSGAGTNKDLSFYMGATNVMTLNNSGNLGIGTTSPAYGLDVQGSSNTSIRVYSPNYPSLRVHNSSTGTGNSDGLLIEMGGTDALIDNYEAGNLKFATNNIEAMRIDSSGFLMVGTTTVVAQLTVKGGGWAMSAESTAGANSAYVFFSKRNSNGIQIHFDQSGTACGDISTNGSATTYATSSDYRLKNTIAPMTGALAKVSQLKPVTYKWNVDGSDSQGFIAHELQEVVPECVTGEKDGTREEEYEVTPAVKDEEGNITTPAVMGTRTVPVYQGIDTSFLVATLTSAIQELSTLITAQQSTIQSLTERITALEGART